MYIEYDGSDSILVYVSDEVKELSPAELFLKTGNVVAAIVWELAKTISEEDEDVLGLAEKLSELVPLLVRQYILKEKEEPNKNKELKMEFYDSMLNQYEVYLKSSGKDGDALVRKASKMQNPKLETREKDGMYYFDVVSDDGTIINLGSVSAKAIPYEQDSKSVDASTVAFILFDKAFGSEDERHPLRGDNAQMFSVVGGNENA